MTCPNCKHNLDKKVKLGSVVIDQCSSCLGFWFEGDELRKAKDEKNIYAKWFDFDLWKDQTSFKSKETNRICPIDGAKLFKLNYNTSSIEIDACKNCNTRGII